MNLRALFVYFIFIFYFDLGFSQIITYSGSYGVYGNNLKCNDIQYQMEFSDPLDIGNISVGLKWRALMGSYRGLNVEGFTRWYTGYKNSYYGNDRLYLQGKIGYGLLKPNSLASFSTPEKFKFTPLFGAGVGYKILIKKLITIDVLMGYHNQLIPKFSNVNDEYLKLRNKNWGEDIGSPFELQWGLGFIID